MAEQDSIGRKSRCLRHDGHERHRPELGIDKSNVVTVVDQGTADRQQAERRQMVVGNPAADSRMRHVDEKNTHG